MTINLPENIWNSPVLRKRFAAEAIFEGNNGFSEKPHYWFVAPEGDSKRGSVEIRNFKPSVFDIDPHELQKIFAQELQMKLQKEIHYDGLWVVGWTHPPATYDVIRTDGDNCWGRLAIIWLDCDADPQYTVESELEFAEILQNGKDYYVKLAEEAHQSWLETYGHKVMKSDMGLREDQLTKSALSSLQ